MKLKVYGIIFLGLGLGLAANAATKAVYKVTRMSDTQVAVSCNSGANPSAVKMGDVVILSCETN